MLLFSPSSLQTGFHEFLVKCETMDLDMSALGRAGAPPVVGAAQRDALRHKGLTRDKLLSKPLSEIVAHETERVTPSYVKIPADYPKLSCSGRTEVGEGSRQGEVAAGGRWRQDGGEKRMEGLCSASWGSAQGDRRTSALPGR